MAYDVVRQRVALFGGGGPSGFLGDTWEWDGFNWQQRASQNSPSARFHHRMAYDVARQRVLLFGGFNGAGSFGDTWEWDGANWVERFPANSPPPRNEHAMAYDAAHQRVIVFGGVAGLTFLGDTWEWDGTNWVPRFSSNWPSPRASAAMDYDATQQRIVLFGGRGVSGMLGDTWEWDDFNWQQRFPTTSPAARAYHRVAYYPPGQRIVLFGGDGTPTSGQETWVNGTPTTPPYTTPALASAFGTGCGSPALGLLPDANGRPVLGQVASATIANAPTPLAAITLGFNNQFFGPFALPVTLTGIGMPGCDLLHSADLLGLGVSALSATTLSFSLPLPNAPSLLGSHVYLQAYAIAPGANPLQVIISNGIDWLLGDY